MTPMIDVVFLLLIFFICASAAYVVELQLPTPMNAGSVDATITTPTEQPLGDVWLTLQREQVSAQQVLTTVSLNGRRFADRQQLAVVVRQLAEAAPEIPVVLDIEKNVPMQDVVEIYDLCRSARFRHIRFAAESRRED